MALFPLQVEAAAARSHDGHTGLKMMNGHATGECVHSRRRCVLGCPKYQPERPSLNSKRATCHRVLGRYYREARLTEVMELASDLGREQGLLGGFRLRVAILIQ